MGKKSIKENKTKYQELREACGLTRERASELMEFVTPDRIEKVESEKSPARPEEVLAMSDCYNTPELCNYYCTHECAIGKKYVTEVKVKELSQIVLESLAALDKFNDAKKRFVEITVDGVITEDELDDFNDIRSTLEDLSVAVDSLKYWVERAAKENKV